MNKIKDADKFTDILNNAIKENGGINKFSEIIKLEKKQIYRLLKKNGPKKLQSRTINKIQPYFNMSADDIQISYTKQFNSKYEPKVDKHNNKLKILLTKQLDSKMFLEQFNGDQIVETSFEVKPTSEDQSILIYDMLNHIKTTSKLVKESWSYADYYSFFPSSKFNYYKERDSEDFAKLTYLNETKDLIEKLRTNKIYIFCHKYNFNINLLVSDNKISSRVLQSSFLNYEIFKIIISDEKKDKISRDVLAQSIETVKEEDQEKFHNNLSRKLIGEKEYQLVEAYERGEQDYISHLQDEASIVDDF